MLPRAKGLIFDCDGTLVDSSSAYSDAWRAGFRLSGVEMDAPWYAARNGLSEHVLMDHFEREYGVVLRRDDVVTTMRRHYLHHLGDHLREVAAVTMIARRFSGNLPMAVASGGSKQIVEASLQALGLTDLFDTIVTFDDVGIAKPNPGLFLEAAKRLNVPNELCLVFEDSVQGIEAAQRANMPCCDIRQL
ncbi:HAD family hydrolase [Pseudomonas sp. 18175]|uniref:HAD family hydrolase n=1 Tax=Pseudomonas sp. 18175 TaxID=3390056 RepID=UPI003D22D25E